MSNVNVAFSEREAKVLDELCEAQDLSKTALLRQALRLYQMIHIKRASGLEMAFVDASGNAVRTEIISLPAFD
jgi:hypothetical protein